MANKGVLRQAYVKFYYEEAKQIIDDFYAGKTKNAMPKLSRRYNEYTLTMLIIFVISLFCCITGCLAPIGIVGFISFACLALFMPKDLKNEAENYNKWQKENNPQIKVKNSEDVNMAPYFDKEVALKEQLMQKFLAIFGAFKWQKWKSYFNTNDLIILPDKLSLDSDDCIMGKYEDTNIKITEVLFGWKSMMAAYKHHANKLSILFPILFVSFFVVVCSFFFSVSEEDLNKLFFGYISFFLLVWGMGFFAPLIMLAVYFKNKNNRGLIVEIDMPKNFKGETVLFENALTNLSVDKKALKMFEKTQLEDTEFNKKYSIYTNNQIEARYVLTTAFIEHLKNIKFRFEARYLRMRFKNNRITIFASVNKDLFQMVKSGQKTDMKTFDVLFEEIYSVLSLVDELKLNVKTGL